MSEINDKFVAIKLPQDLHIYLKAKAKEKGMTMGNYLFDCLCKHHNIKYVPATVEIPKEEQKPKPVVDKLVFEEPTPAVEKPAKDEINQETGVTNEVMEDIESMEKEELEERPEETFVEHNTQNLS